MKYWQAPGVGFMQEGGFLSVGLLPVAHKIDLAPVGEREAGDVDSVAEGVFGEAARRRYYRSNGSYRRRRR